MNLKEKLNHFFNVTLGADYEDQEDIKESNNPEFAELKKSLERIQTLEEKFNNSTTAKKSEKNKIIETVVVDPKLAIKLEKSKKEAIEKETEER